MGRLWFTENSGNNIAHITTSGSITEFPIPTSHSAPVGLTVGPDGGIWFVESSGNKIGRLAPPTFPPIVTSISPNIGSVTGGASVTVTGTSFTGATAVAFGSTTAAAFTVNSATSITATAPVGHGTVDVTVTTPAGTSTTSSADQFTYGLAVSHDFNGDLKSDILWRNVDFRVALWFMHGPTISGSTSIYPGTDRRLVDRRQP